MRHRKKGSTTFGRRKAQRKAMLKNIVASLIKQKRIETTLKKAKEVSKIADKLVTFGKKNTIHARRQAYKILSNRDLVKKLFDEIAILYINRNGGYTRIIKTGYRKGDTAPTGILEFIEEEKKSKEKTKSKSKTNALKKQVDKKASDKKVIKAKAEIKSDLSNNHKIKKTNDSS